MEHKNREGRKLEERDGFDSRELPAWANPQSLCRKRLTLLMARGEAVAIDQVLRDRHGIAAT